MNNHDMPLVSIVFTSYNHKEYLRQAIESLINQTFQDFELIVVDDNSTDGSQEILNEYSNNNKVSLNLLTKNTGSYVKASNYGAKLAKGKYLLFAQCDDFSHPSQLDKLVLVLENKPEIGVVYSRSNLVDKNGIVFDDDFRGREQSFKELCIKSTSINSSQMRSFLSHSCVIPNLSAALLRKDLYLKINGLSEKYLLASDWAFWLDLANLTDFYYINEPLNNFRQHDTTIRNTIKSQKQILEIYDIFYNYINTSSLNKNEIQKFKTGAGLIWFTYLFSDGFKWIVIFRKVLVEVKKIEKFPLYYLVKGVFVFVKEYFSNKLRLI